MRKAQKHSANANRFPLGERPDQDQNRSQSRGLGQTKGSHAPGRGQDGAADRIHSNSGAHHGEFDWRAIYLMCRYVSPYSAAAISSSCCSCFSYFSLLPGRLTKSANQITKIIALNFHTVMQWGVGWVPSFCTPLPTLVPCLMRPPARTGNI